MVNSYVYEYPLNGPDVNSHVLGFINSVILTIFELVDKLIDLHIYALHPIISNIICYYTPIDDINEYKSSDNDEKN